MQPVSRKGTHKCTGPIIVVAALACLALWVLFFLSTLLGCAPVEDGDLRTPLALPRSALQQVSQALDSRFGRKGKVDQLVVKARELLAKSGWRPNGDSSSGGATWSAPNSASGNGHVGSGELEDIALALTVSLMDALSEEGTVPAGLRGRLDSIVSKRNSRSSENEPVAAGGTAAAGSFATDSGGRKSLPPPEFDPEGMYTQQTCYVQVDETEICVYEGTFCFDGLSPVVVVDEPVTLPQRINDFTHSCMDPRYYEPGSLEDGGCSYQNSGERKSFNVSKLPSPQTDTPMSLRMRRWGPLNRNGLLFFREMTPSQVWGSQPQYVVADHSAVVPGASFYDPSLDVIGAGSSGGDGSSGSEGASTVNAPARLAAEKAAADGGGSDKPSNGKSGSSGVSEDTMIVKEGPFQVEGVPGLTINRRTRSGNVTVDWIDGALWIAGIDGQWFSNPYHWFSKIGALFDAMRVNSTPNFGDHPMDSYPHTAPPGYFGNRMTTTLASEAAAALAPYPPGSKEREEFLAKMGLENAANKGKDPIPAQRLQNLRNRLQFRVAAQWDIPPMDNVFFAGDGAYPLANKDALSDWFRSTLDLAIQPHTQTYFNNAIEKLSPNHMVCSRRGVIPGAKNKMFTGRADAWLYRQYAYSHSAVHTKGLKSHPLNPPRKITIIDRKGMNGRGIYNKEDILAAAIATGLPYEVVPNMGKLSFKEQVALMAGTGILIAPHGAHLANIMFLPAHAVVIEMFPYLMKKNTYRYLANLLDLHYFPIYSWNLLPTNMTQYYGVDLMNEMYFWENCVATNISSYDALNVHACNAASKNYPIVVDTEQLRGVMKDAVDSIAAYSWKNKEWKAIVDRDNIQKPVPPPHIRPTQRGSNG